jgi:hypothetical protein
MDQSSSSCLWGPIHPSTLRPRYIIGFINSSSNLHYFPTSLHNSGPRQGRRKEQTILFPVQSTYPDQSTERDAEVEFYMHLSEILCLFNFQRGLWSGVSVGMPAPYKSDKQDQ